MVAVNNAQRVLLTTYLPLTVLIMISEYRYSQADIMAWLKITVSICLALTTVGLRKVYLEQKVMAAAFVFMAAGDVLFAIPPLVGDWSRATIPMGIAGFLVAYICLIIAFRKDASISKTELLIALPILAVIVFLGVLLFPFVNLVLFMGMAIFALVLGYMTLTAVATIPRGYYSTKSAWLIALAGCLIFVSDMRLAYETLYPVGSGLIPLGSNYVRGPFVVGWALLSLVVAEHHLLKTTRLSWRG